MNTRNKTTFSYPRSTSCIITQLQFLGDVKRGRNKNETTPYNIPGARVIQLSNKFNVTHKPSKILAFDLDDTLIQQDPIDSDDDKDCVAIPRLMNADRVKQLLQQAQKNNIMVVIITARKSHLLKEQEDPTSPLAIVSRLGKTYFSSIYKTGRCVTDNDIYVTPTAKYLVLEHLYRELIFVSISKTFTFHRRCRCESSV